MDVSGEVADLMVKESIQITEETVKLLAAGSKNLAAFLLALAQDNKKLSGKTNMARLLREGKELKVFHIKESDLADFKGFARKNMLYSIIRDSRSTDGMVDLITNYDYVSQMNHFMESRGYPVPGKDKAQGDETPKKDAPRAQPGSSSPQRGSGSNPSRSRSRTGTERTAGTRNTTTPTSDKPSVKGRLAAFRAAAEGMEKAGKTPQRTRGAPPKTR